MRLKTACRALFYLIVTLSTLVSSTATAAVLVSNLAEPLRDASPIGNPGTLPPPPVGDWSWATQSFAPDNTGYDLVSIEAIVGNGTLNPLPSVVAELHDDNAGDVGALITTFTTPDVSGAPSARTFTPDNPVTLSANTTYWFVLGVQSPGDGTFFWSYAQGNGSTGPGALLSYAYSSDSGGTWVNFGSDNPFFVRVNVVPEPASAAVLGSLGVAFGLSRLRRKHS